MTYEEQHKLRGLVEELEDTLPKLGEPLSTLYKTVLLLAKVVDEDHME